ncbi:PREDICTED: ATP-binding cassette sub-family D member 4, partial [Nanorana parkeri]|uniref:ATP-binding cassette sub-family D member 4 n=1 Tax=Nanorana parkeri TaxID=125878 RepID=UPI0008543423
CTGQLIVYQVGILPSQFYGILSDRDLAGFRKLAALAAALIIVISMLRSAEQYISKLVYVNCRKVMTQHLHQMYFTRQVYYTMSVEHGHIDNPDQRMTQDVERLCRELTNLATKILTTPFTLIYYSYHCAISTGWVGPVSIFGYFLIGSLLNKILMGPVIPKLVEQEKLEGDFRFKHVQIRVNAEAAAFSRAGCVEYSRTERRLKSLIGTQKELMYQELWLSFLVLMLAISPQNAFVSIYLVSCFSQIIDLSSNLCDVAGYTHRIGELVEVMMKIVQEDEEFNPEKEDDGCVVSSSGVSIPDHYLYIWGCPYHILNASSGRSSLEKSQDGDGVFILDNITITSPGSECTLVRDLSLCVSEGSNLLISGETGSGKSSILRVLAGLWKTKHGRVSVFSPFGPHGVVFLPQKSFLSDGSLREQVRAHVSHDALLDEASSALSEDAEAELYAHCTQMGMTLISVGHRRSLQEFHHMELRLDPGGHWELRRLRKS